MKNPYIRIIPAVPCCACGRFTRKIPLLMLAADGAVAASVHNICLRCAKTRAAEIADTCGITTPARCEYGEEPSWTIPENTKGKKQ